MRKLTAFLLLALGLTTAASGLLTGLADRDDRESKKDNMPAPRARFTARVRKPTEPPVQSP